MSLCFGEEGTRRLQPHEHCVDDHCPSFTILYSVLFLFQYCNDSYTMDGHKPQFPLEHGSFWFANRRFMPIPIDNLYIVSGGSWGLWWEAEMGGIAEMACIHF